MKKIIVITDSAFGRPFNDPDDGLALHYLLNSSRVDLLTIVTTEGNTTEQNVFASVKNILKNENKNVLIIRSGDKNVSSKIYNLVREYPNKVSILSLGPLTVIERVLRNYPKISNYWRELVIMGGLGKIRHPFYPFITEEFNQRKDKPAFEYVTKITKHKLVTKEDCLKEIFKIADIIKFPKWMWANLLIWYFLNLFIGKNGFNPNDLTAAKVLVDS